MNRPLIITICCFLASIFIACGLVWPKYQDLKSLDLKVQEKEMELQSREAYFSQLKQIEEKFANYEEGLDKINFALPQDISLPALFDYFQKVSSENGLVLENIGAVSSTTSGEKRAVQEHLMNISVIGSYSSFKNFLCVLEKSSRLIEIESISFHSPREEETTFSFNLIVKAFSY